MEIKEENASFDSAETTETESLGTAFLGARVTILIRLKSLFSLTLTLAHLEQTPIIIKSEYTRNLLFHFHCYISFP